MADSLQSISLDTGISLDSLKLAALASEGKSISQARQLESAEIGRIYNELSLHPDNYHVDSAALAFFRQKYIAPPPPPTTKQAMTAPSSQTPTLQSHPPPVQTPARSKAASSAAARSSSLAPAQATAPTQQVALRSDAASSQKRTVVPPPPPPRPAAAVPNLAKAPAPEPPRAILAAAHPLPKVEAKQAAKAAEQSIEVDGKPYIARVGLQTTVYFIRPGIGVELANTASAQEAKRFVAFVVRYLDVIDASAPVGHDLLGEFLQGGNEVPGGPANQYEGVRLVFSPLAQKTDPATGVKSFEPIQTDRIYGCNAKGAHIWPAVKGAGGAKDAKGAKMPSIPRIQLPSLEPGQAIIYAEHGQGGGVLVEKLQAVDIAKKENQVIVSCEGVVKHPDFTKTQPYDVTIFHEGMHAFLVHTGASVGMPIKGEEQVVVGLGKAQGARYSENNYRIECGYGLRTTYRSVGLEKPDAQRQNWPANPKDGQYAFAKAATLA